MNADRLINATAEAALLGALLLDNRLIGETADRVKPGDFGDALHGRIYGLLLRFASKGMRADALTLRPLFAHDADAQYGAYLDELVDTPAIVGSAQAIAIQVADLASRREARGVMRDALDALHDDLDRTVQEICATVDAAGWESGDDDGEALDAADLIGLVEERDDRINDDPGAAGMSNRLVEDMDKGLGYLEAGTYNLIAGRPGMGKSALASSGALGYAMNGNAFLYIQLEMTAEQMGIRVASDLSHSIGFKLPHTQLRKGGLSGADRQDLARTREVMRALPIRFRSLKAGTDIRHIWSIVARQKALWKAAGRELKGVVIDYLGLCGANDSEGRYIDDDRKRMNVVSKTVKMMAAELGVAILALAQLSRGVEARQDKRPMLSDLKESGNLEQDADTVTLVYRKEYYLQQTEPKRGERDKAGVDLHEEWEVEFQQARDKADLIFAKNRHGRSSTRTVRFVSDHVAMRSGDFDPFSDAPALDLGGEWGSTML